MFSKPRRSPGSSSGAVLCKTFQDLSRSTWTLLRRGRQQGVQINEETITNLLMLRLQETKSPYLRVKSFSKKQESRTGADWEWWLGSPGSWVGFRLQAKVINFSSDRFEHLYYVPPGGVPQYQRLLDDALHAWPRRIPLYCLYIHWQQSIGYRRTSRAGCSFLSPLLVRSLAPQPKRGLADLYEYTRPWHELVCPQNAPSVRQSLAAGVLSSVRQLYEESRSADPVGVFNPNEGAFQELFLDMRPASDVPAYVQQVRVGEQPVIEDDPQLEGVTVFEELPNPERPDER